MFKGIVGKGGTSEGNAKKVLKESSFTDMNYVPTTNALWLFMK